MWTELSYGAVVLRTMDPARVRASFDAQIADAFGFYIRVKTGLGSDADLTRLSALSLMSAATIWESFLSDLVIAYINRDPSQFSTHLENALKQDLSGKQKQIQSRYAPFVAPSSIDRKTIISLLDSDGNNITFKSAAHLKKTAKIWITTGNRVGIEGLTSQQMAIIDLTVALRNHIAHDSERSRDALKIAVSKGALHGSGLHRAQNAIHTPGVYLKSKHQQPGGNPRVEEILGHMRAIGAAI